MADVLDQSEVDALLSAVDSGGGDTGEPEVFARSRAKQQEVRTYDFKRPERVSKEQLKGLQSLFESFAREVSIILPATADCTQSSRLANVTDDPRLPGA